jgi:hypothetical protein
MKLGTNHAGKISEFLAKSNAALIDKAQAEAKIVIRRIFIVL